MANSVLLGLGNDSLGMGALHAVKAGQVAAGAALADDIARGTSLDVVVGDVAAIRGLVPEGVAVDAGARGLAGELEVGALRVGLNQGVASTGAGAAVERGLGRVRAHHGRDGRKEDREGGGKLHGG